MTQYVIGYGMGRCGTKSLAYLLNLQPDSSFTHELDGLHWQTVFSNYRMIRDLFKRKAEKYKFVGDVNYAWAQYALRVVEDFPCVKFIHIWRDKEESVESFWKLSQARIEAQKTVSLWAEESLWYTIYPFFGFPPTKDQIANTYEIFHKIAETMMYKYPRQTYTIKMDSLNNTDSIKKLLDFVGIPEKEQVVQKVQANKGGSAKMEFNVVQRGGVDEKYHCVMKAGISLKASA